MEQFFSIAGSAFSTVPGGSATVILFDSTGDPGTGTTLSRRKAYSHVSRATVRVYMDQAATFFADDLTLNSTTWRPYDVAAGFAITANTWFEKNVLFTSDDHRLRIVTGTAPTVWEVSVRLWTFPGLAQ